MMTEAPPAEAAAAVPSTTVAEYSVVLASLAELRRRYAGLAFDLTTTKGNTEARQARQALVKLRTSLEDKRKEIKAPALARARAIDDDARLIREAIEALEGPIDQQIQADEARRESERAARVAAELQRIEAIRRRMLDAFTGRFMKVSAGTAADITACMAQIEATPGEAFEDLQLEAETMKGICLDRLRVMHAAAVTHERQQAARLAEQAQQESEAEERRKAEAAEREAQRRALKLQEDDLRLFLETNIRAGSPLPDTSDECLAEAARLEQFGPTPTLEGDHRRRAEEGRLDRIAGLRVKAERLRQSAENDRLRAENAKLAAEKAERERAEAEARAQQEAIDRAHRETQERIAREEAAVRQRQCDAEQALLDRMRGAAPTMVEALKKAHAFAYRFSDTAFDETLALMLVIDEALREAGVEPPTYVTTESAA